MDRDLLHSIYIELPEDLKRDVFKEYQRVTKKYKDLRKHEFKTQISIYAAYLPEDATERFIQNASEFLAVAKFKVTLSKYSLTDNGRGSGYIFIDLNVTSAKEVLELNATAKAKMKDLEIGSFRDYPFSAHLSLIKLPTNELEEAFDSLRDGGILNRSFEVSELILAKQKDQEDWASIFPTVGKVPLR